MWKNKDFHALLIEGDKKRFQGLVKNTYGFKNVETYNCFVSPKGENSVDNLVENQLVVGKDPSYPYSDTVDDFGSSHSIIIECHYTRPERIGLKEQRL